MGFRIFLHSLRLVFTQLRDALRVSGLLYIVNTVLSLVGIIFFMRIDPLSQAPTFSWQFYPLLLIGTVTTLWITVGWHRFVLLDEQPNAVVPVFHGGRLLAYFGRLLQVGLVCMLALLAVVLAYGALIYASQGAWIVTLIGMLVVYAVTLLIAYRFAPVFPAAAIGDPVNFGEAWASTSGSTGAILVLAIVSVVAATVIDLPAQLLLNLPAGWIFVLIWLQVTAWIKLMVGISILTTIHGVYVEKREIA